MEQYKSLQSERNKSKSKGKLNKSSKAVDDPVVDDSNVLETIDVSTSGVGPTNDSEGESDSDEEDEEVRY